MANKRDKTLPKDMQSALKMFPKVVKAKEKAALEKRKVLKNFAPFSRKLDALKKKTAKAHPWRMCPGGMHWVAAHPLSVPVSEKNPSGVTLRDGHCRTNRSRKDQLYADEIHEIASNHFDSVEHLPKNDNLGRDKGNDFDRIIGGWTTYWNGVFRPPEPLSANLIKALIATESDFNRNAKAAASKGNLARGLMQVTDQTLDILGDEKGELKDYLIDIDQSEINDPNLNICAGIRWLFHKKFLLERRLNRPAKWEEAAMEYKSYTKKLMRKEPSAARQWKKFLEIYEALKR